MEEKEIINENGKAVPEYYNKLNKYQKRIFDNQDKEPIDRIFYCIEFKNGRKQFGTSNSRYNFNLKDFEEDKLKNFPNGERVVFFETLEEFKKAQKGN